VGFPALGVGDLDHLRKSGGPSMPVRRGQLPARRFAAGPYRVRALYVGPTMGVVCLGIRLQRPHTPFAHRAGPNVWVRFHRFGGSDTGRAIDRALRRFRGGWAQEPSRGSDFDLSLIPSVLRGRRRPSPVTGRGSARTTNESKPRNPPSVFDPDGRCGMVRMGRGGPRPTPGLISRSCLTA
jgi:hypothetical protein